MNVNRIQKVESSIEAIVSSKDSKVIQSALKAIHSTSFSSDKSLEVSPEIESDQRIQDLFASVKELSSLEEPNSAESKEIKTWVFELGYESLKEYVEARLENANWDLDGGTVKVEYSNQSIACMCLMKPPPPTTLPPIVFSKGSDKAAEEVQGAVEFIAESDKLDVALKIADEKVLNCSSDEQNLWKQFKETLSTFPYSESFSKDPTQRAKQYRAHGFIRVLAFLDLIEKGTSTEAIARALNLESHAKIDALEVEFEYLSDKVEGRLKNLKDNPPEKEGETEEKKDNWNKEIDKLQKNWGAFKTSIKTFPQRELFSKTPQERKLQYYPKNGS